jgi:hypothetical protein
MNPLAVESAFKSALASSAFPTAAIFTGTNYEELPPESLNLIVSVASFSTVGPGLYTAVATVRVTSPSLLGSESYTQFSGVLETLKNAVTQSYLLANWPTSDAPNFCGSYLENVTTGMEQNIWTAELTLTIGVMD